MAATVAKSPTDTIDGLPRPNPYDSVAQAVPIPSDAPTLTVLSLTSLVFFSVSGGSFSTIQAVRSGGAFYALLGYMIAPFALAWQETQMTAELSLAYPHSSGSVVWCEAAFGPFVGWLNGTLSLVSGITENAIYPGLFASFILARFSQGTEDEESPFVRFAIVFSMILVMGYINYCGLNSIGNTTILIGVIALTPFVIFMIVGMFEVDPSRWLDKPSLTIDAYESESDYELGGGFFPYATLGGVILRPFVNVMFWCFNAFDSAATWSEDCGPQPDRVIPKSLNIAWFTVSIFYLLPVAVAIGVSSGNQSDWKIGYLASLATETVGQWLGNWLIFASGISFIALYQAEMSSDVFKLMGMAHNGLLPKFFGVRSAHGTPVNAIVFESVIIFGLSWLHQFHKLIEMQNFTYGMALLLEYAAFIQLRLSRPNGRSFRVHHSLT